MTASPVVHAARMKNEIDELINRTCNNVVGGELSQLGALFNGTFLRELQKIIFMNELGRSPALIVEVDMQLAWIDKAPYAKLISGHPFTNKVELGDAMFIFEEIDISTNNTSTSSNKAFILQAKVTKNKYKACSVPITTCSKNNSTYKEFHLYEKWSPFDLSYSTKGGVEATNINLTKHNPDCIRFAWYGVAQYQQTIPTNDEWRCRWMVGKAEMNAVCDRTLGDLLTGFFQSTPLDGAQVGEYYSNSSVVNKDWQRVVHHIINCCKGLKMPSYVPDNTSFRNRIVSANKILSFLRSNNSVNLFGGRWFDLLREVNDLRAGHPDLNLISIIFYCFRQHFNGSNHDEFLNFVFQLEQYLESKAIGSYIGGEGVKLGAFPVVVTTVRRFYNDGENGIQDNIRE